MSFSYKIEKQSQLKKKCFLRISSTGEIVFSSRIQLFELFKHHQQGDHSGDQEFDQHGDHQDDDPVLDGLLGGDLGDDDPLLDAGSVRPLDQAWPKIGPNI